MKITDLDWTLTCGSRQERDELLAYALEKGLRLYEDEEHKLVDDDERLVIEPATHARLVILYHNWEPKEIDAEAFKSMCDAYAAQL